VPDDCAEKVDQLTSDVRDIRVALTGNGYGVSKGLIGSVENLCGQVETLEVRVERVEDWQATVKWTVIGAAIGSGVASGTIITLIVKALGG